MTLLITSFLLGCDSNQYQIVTGSDVARINQLLSKLGLPEKIRKVAVEDILKFMAYDKKFQAAQNRFVLSNGIGNVKVVEGVNPRMIRLAIESCR